MKVICFAGFKHVGKSYYGSKIAQKFGLNFMDLDKMLEKKHQRTISEVYKMYGAHGFHQKEFEAIQSLDFQSPMIIALGGATLLNQNSLAFLSSKSHIIHLECSFEEIKKRIFEAKYLWTALDPLDKEGSLKTLYEKRMQYYRSLQLPTFNLVDNQAIIKLEDYVRQFIR